MAVRSESRIDIAAAASSAYGYLADVSRWPEWAAMILSCRVAGAAPLEAGTRLEQQVKKMFGGSGSRTLDVTVAEAPRRLGFAGTMGPSPITWGLDLHPTSDDRTEVVLWIEAVRRGPMRMMPAGLLTTMFRRVNQRELAAIKTAVEADRDKATPS